MGEAIKDLLAKQDLEGRIFSFTTGDITWNLFPIVLIIGLLYLIRVGFLLEGKDDSSSGYGDSSGSGYGAPSSGYGAPSESYGAPAPSYGAPSESYGAPAPSYNAPTPSYGAPASSFGGGSLSSGYTPPSGNSGGSITYGGSPQDSAFLAPPVQSGYSSGNSANSVANFGTPSGVQAGYSGNFGSLSREDILQFALQDLLGYNSEENQDPYVYSSREFPDST
ncbi:hypothetical protein TCAL_04556, partial [Tigriopus californicus]|eukprot:TCALIF_04556-PA protein Name:"Protein of unknown function" AED:0.21 eAED:0.21 QI:46/1/0.33/1/1/0.66/3/0/221